MIDTGGLTYVCGALGVQVALVLCINVINLYMVCS